MARTDQRMYASGYGNFASPDPATSSISVRSPGTWDRYSYVLGDPINQGDPSGLDPSCDPSDSCCDPGSSNAVVPDPSRDLIPNAACYGGGGGGGGGGGDSEGAIIGVDTHPGKALPFNLQTRVYAAIPGTRKALAQWSTQSQNCLTDLGDIGMSQKQVQQYAANASVTFVNALNNPAALATITNYESITGGQVDFMISTTSPTNTVWVDPNSLWQTTPALLAGTLVHEFAHLANPTLSDSAMQLALFGKAGVDPNNTSNISTKLASDCFGNIMKNVP